MKDALPSSFPPFLLPIPFLSSSLAPSIFPKHTQWRVREYERQHEMERVQSGRTACWRQLLFVQMPLSLSFSFIHKKRAPRDKDEVRDGKMEKSIIV